MENFSKIELNNNEISKKELKEEKEKSRLNLRKSKLDKILFSKRMITFLNESDNDIKKNYDLNLDDIINNIPDKFKIDIPIFLDRVRNNKFLFFNIVRFIYYKRIFKIGEYLFQFIWRFYHKAIFKVK